MKDFQEADLIGHGDNYKRIYTDKNELIDNPLWYHKRGLSQTASGYGSKLTTPYMIQLCGRTYRIYCTTYSNSGTCWITRKHKTIYIEA